MSKAFLTRKYFQWSRKYYRIRSAWIMEKIQSINFSSEANKQPKNQNNPKKPKNTQKKKEGKRPLLLLENIKKKLR